MRNYDKLFKAGNKAQLEKLKRDKHKGSWEEICIEDLFIKLRVEVVELHESVLGGDFKDIRQEAADVANFAHMLIQACDSVLEVTK